MRRRRTILLLSFIIGLTFSSCKKKDETVPAIVNPKETVADMGANDETARAEYDRSLDDIFTALGNTSLNTGRASGPQGGVILPCGVIKIDSTSIPGVFKFVYDSTCGVRVLSGSISVALTKGAMWSDVGAELQLTFNNYNVLYTVNNQTLTFNGPMYITNVDGGWAWQVLTGSPSKTHAIRGSIDITFDKNDTRRWRIRKKRIFQSSSASAADLTLTLDKDSAVAEVGTTRNGDPFTTDITVPFKYINCNPQGNITGPFVAVTGTLVYATATESMTAEAGYKLVNQQATLDGTCSSEGYKLTYQIMNQTISAFQYY